MWIDWFSLSLFFRVFWGCFALTAAAGVDKITKLFAGLEVGNSFRRHGHGSACLGVTPRSRFPLSRPETAEAANLHLVTTLESVDDRFKQGFYDDLAVTTCKVSQRGYPVDQIGFCHEYASGAEPNKPVSLRCWSPQLLCSKGSYDSLRPRC